MSLAVKIAALLALVAAPAAADPVKLKLERQPPRLRMRVAATPKAEPAPEPEPVADVKQTAADPNVELGVLRDLRRPISVRFNLGYVVDGAASTGAVNQDYRRVGEHEWAQLRAYALGEGYFSSRGVILPSLSTYFAGRFQLVRRSLKSDPSIMPTGPTVEVAPPVATWFEESGTTVQSGWAEVQDFLPDKRLAPVRVRVGNQ